MVCLFWFLLLKFSIVTPLIISVFFSKARISTSPCGVLAITSDLYREGPRLCPAKHLLDVRQIDNGIYGGQLTWQLC